MIRGGTCLLLLLVAAARRGDCKPIEQGIHIFSPEVLAHVHDRLLQEEDIKKIEQEFGALQLAEMLQEYLERPEHRPMAHQQPLKDQQFQRIREYMDLLTQDPPLVETGNQVVGEDEIIDLDPESDKRGGYMSLCHFKICNMGRKRSVGNPMPMMKSP